MDLNWKASRVCNSCHKVRKVEQSPDLICQTCLLGICLASVWVSQEQGILKDQDGDHAQALHHNITKLCLNMFVYSFINKFLLSSYYEPDTVSGLMDIVVI